MLDVFGENLKRNRALYQTQDVDWMLDFYEGRLDVSPRDEDKPVTISR
jgi:hypothetical protein